MDHPLPQDSFYLPERAHLSRAGNSPWPLQIRLDLCVFPWRKIQVAKVSFVYEVQQPMQMNGRWEDETLKWMGEGGRFCVAP